MSGIAEWQRRAAEVLAASTVDYYDGGAGEQTSVGAAERAWSRLALRPRVLRDVSAVDTFTALLGRPLAAPMLVAPTAQHGLAHPDGEVATARGAAAAGVPLILSMRSTRDVADVATVAGQWWQQVYVVRDRGRTRAAAEQAAALGAQALVLTGDTPMLGRPRADRGPDEQACDVTFGDIEWLASTGLPVLVKGVLRADDAEACLGAGAAGVVVSNHGGRQLDGAVPTAYALKEVVQAVAGRGVVLVDGGLRRGVDVLRALALGADAVCIGRPVLWGLAVDGAAGVHAVLTQLTAELTHAMALAGAPSLTEITPDLLA